MQKTLLDEFAMAALGRLLLPVETHGYPNESFMNAVAETAYGFAEAMIAERERRLAKPEQIAKQKCEAVPPAGWTSNGLNISEILGVVSRLKKPQAHDNADF